ncbi:MAG: ROK family protein [Gammaproteobacteria bacterium]|nr:ROK family protein [Gammaproteobacteria bacterium]
MDWTRKGERRIDPDRPRPLADAVLRLIWEEKQISRAEIARLAGLSPSTVSEIISEILPLGLVAEVGSGQSRGGRRPILLDFQDQSCVIIGVEMGASHICVALTDLRGNILFWNCCNHPVREDPEGTRARIMSLCKECMAPSVVGGRPLVGIGVGVPCPVDPADPKQLSKVVLPAWDGSLDLQELSDYFGVPIMVDNDANLGALAERWWGAGRDVDDFAYIKVATGIGCGHVIGGEIYRGATGVAGEIGHMSLDPYGKLCVCGLRGCLATFIGGSALVDRTAELLPMHTSSALMGCDLTIENIEKAALAGDSLAIRVVRDAANHLGVAVAGLLNIMNPSLVVIGGDLATLGDLLIFPLRKMVQQRTLVSSMAAAEIIASQVGHQSVALGASTLVLKSALSDSRYFPAVSQGPKKRMEGTS